MPAGFLHLIGIDVHCMTGDKNLTAVNYSVQSENRMAFGGGARGGINRSALGIDTRIFRLIIYLYFFIIQQLIGHSLRDFAPQSITTHN
jgi:hypothetical protein